MCCVCIYCEGRAALSRGKYGLVYISRACDPHSEQFGLIKSALPRVYYIHLRVCMRTKTGYETSLHVIFHEGKNCDAAAHLFDVERH